MSAAENPFDTPIPDPFDPREVIQDRMHGPDAVAAMRAVPPMPLGDYPGLYYQTGGSYRDAMTPYTDALGRPVHYLGTIRRLPHLLTEWLDANSQGPEALQALEAQRQRQRLQDTRVLYAFKPSDICGGGKRLDACETAAPMVSAADQYAKSVDSQPVAGEGTRWNALAWLGGACGSCALSCVVAVETQDNVPTGITRFAQTQPLASSPSTITLNLAAYDLAPRAVLRLNTAEQQPPQPS